MMHKTEVQEQSLELYSPSGATQPSLAFSCCWGEKTILTRGLPRNFMCLCALSVQKFISESGSFLKWTWSFFQTHPQGQCMGVLQCLTLKVSLCCLEGTRLPLISTARLPWPGSVSVAPFTYKLVVLFTAASTGLVFVMFSHRDLVLNIILLIKCTGIWGNFPKLHVVFPRLLSLESRFLITTQLK